MADKSLSTSIRLGLEHVRVIDPALESDPDDYSLLAGVDYNNYAVELVCGDEKFSIHFTQLAETISALLAFLVLINKE